MGSLGVVAGVLLVVVLLVAAGLLLLVRRRRRPAPGQPRTVADLVRMRGSGSDHPPVSDASVDLAADGDGPRPATAAGSTPARGRVVAGPLGAEPQVADHPSGSHRADSDRAGSAGTGSGESAGASCGDAAPVGTAPGPGRPSPAGPSAAGPAAGSTRAGDDAPWARAARMADTAIVVRAVRPPRPAPAEMNSVAVPARSNSNGVHLGRDDPGAAAAPHVDPAVADHGVAEPTVAGQAGAAPAALDPAAHSVVPAVPGATIGESAPERAAVGPGVTAVPGPVEPMVAEELADEQVTAGPVVEPAAGDGAGSEPSTDGRHPRPNPPTGSAGAAQPADPTPARTAGRVRRRPADTAAEQVAADLALLRTFGVAGPGRAPEPDEDETELTVRSTGPAGPVTGVAQAVRVHVVGRTGQGIDGAAVTLHDHLGQETASVAADLDGRAALTAPHPGGYVLVAASTGHQPGAAALTVDGAPVEAEIVLTRSASLSGTVTGEDGPQAGARVVLVQDGETLESTITGADGGYRFDELRAGEYGLSVTAPDCEPAGVLMSLAEEHDARHDVDVDPAGLPDDAVPSPL